MLALYRAVRNAAHYFTRYPPSSPGQKLVYNSQQDDDKYYYQTPGTGDTGDNAISGVVRRQGGKRRLLYPAGYQR